MKKIVFFCILCAMLSACGSNGCEETRESFCLAELKSVSGTKIVKLEAYGIGQGKGNLNDNYTFDDQVMASANNPTSLELILKPDTTITDFRLLMTIPQDEEQIQINDTLHVVYTHHPYYINMDCGCSMYFNIEDVSMTNHFLQSVTIKRNEITNVQNINLTIEY